MIPENVLLVLVMHIILFISSILELIFMFFLSKVPIQASPKMTKPFRLGFLSVMLDECWC